ncbi:hypothetical protein BXZ70DRAFT_1004419 [Cristinia sonorae]|uniref:Uncharacterized protein n=1 Tax=Cristinia sonorae TaxID=1940300 RepID=A0A8K0UW47_9AGAR|nr:hypothetical protein BXZ70DRAFT_1004419 [Cristinia sonorae]
MFAKLSIAYLACALFLAGRVSCTPTSFPEVIPGPGLPSLESLGLTSADLYSGTSVASLDARDELSSEFTRVCNDNGCGRVPRADAQACVNFLRNLGTTACVVGQTSTVMCTAGRAVVTGTNLSGQSSVSSFCQDVATGAQNVVTFCADSNGLVAGADAAFGNGNLIVSIEGC